MIQRRQHLSFALKASQPFRIAGKLFGQDFDGHIAAELVVVRLIDFTHAAGANGGNHLVGS